jgi:hypothetical protein
MDDSGFLMQVFQCFCNLENYMTRKIFAEVCKANNLMEQFSARTEFENDKVVLARLVEINQLDDVGVIQLSHNLNFLQDIRSL